MTHDPRPAPTPTRRPCERLSRVRLALLSSSALWVIGCATLGGDPGQPLVPSRIETRTGPFALYTNQPIPADAPPLRCLRTLEQDLEASLGLRVAPDSPPVEVYILKDRDAFGQFLTFYYPELPPRRAFFLAQGPKRVIYAFYNDRLDEDLRHEATHALLHAAVGDLPLWLDEGLAEYFEGPGGRQGLNPEHVTRLPDDLKTGWKPDLARLETLKSVREMTPRDYRESWAWVHYLLKSPGAGKASLLGYLADLRAGTSAAEPLSVKLARDAKGDDGQQLLTHLEQIRSAQASGAVASASAKADPAVLLQSAPIGPPPAQNRRGLLGRFLSMVGLSGRPGDQGR